MRKCIVDFVISVAMGAALAVALHFALEGFDPSKIQTREVRTSRPPAAIAVRVVAPEVAPAPRIWVPEMAPEPREVGLRRALGPDEIWVDRGFPRR